MKRVLLLATALLALATPAQAGATSPWLSKRDARENGFAYADSFADMLDPYATVHAKMVPPRKCHRLDRVTVTCRYHVDLISEKRTVSSHVRVHLQKDGFFGILMPLDLWGQMAGRSKRRGLSDF